MSSWRRGAGIGYRELASTVFSFSFWFGVGVDREGLSKIGSGGLGVVAEQTESFPMRIGLKDQCTGEV